MACSSKATHSQDFDPLCYLCVLCVSVVNGSVTFLNHRDTEHTETAQRKLELRHHHLSCLGFEQSSE
jgi:hypothetical protein